ncbi:MAG: hypothetical protein Q8L66_00605 [Caulobacter sp.]|nr:hypothetical protein [Caulobacter sp.]
MAALAAVPCVAAAGGAMDLYYERSLMISANTRCALFDPRMGAALEAARAQARGAALRAGATDDTLRVVASRARTRAAGAACESDDIKMAASRVRKAFDGYSRLSRMTYPGDMSQWLADRTISREGPLWRLAQTSSFGWDQMVFGLGGNGGRDVLLASASFADGASPYAVRLVMRDPERTSGPYLDSRQAGSEGRIPLANRIPPRAATQVFSAEARSPASERLAPAGAKTALLVRFPSSAAEALAALDPRESVMVEFAFAGRDGDAVRRAYVEVGDFAAGRAFLNVAPPR